MISLEEYAKICNLISSCNDMIEGKFILADAKIAKILKDIGESKEIYNVLADCMKTFNYEREFGRARVTSPSKPSSFVLPREPEKMLPLVFCVLMDINSGKIDLNYFLNQYFWSEGGNSAQYKRFAVEIIKPFRDVLAKVFDIDPASATKLEGEALEREEVENEPEEQTPAEVEEEEPEGEQEEASPQDEYFDEIRDLCKDMLTELSCDMKIKAHERDDLEYIINAIISACDDKSIKYSSALIISFGHMAERVKCIRLLAKELKHAMVRFFRGL